MSVVVFTGPTLQASEVRAVLDAEVRPPVAQGDVLAAVATKPSAIGIIDGTFDTLPAVWHKEILWALQSGIVVYGSASMGALRAAELSAFGMRGVGAIFEAYASGQLEDDDEVAVVHGPPETGYRALSVPMVDVRATLEAAAAAGVVSASTRERLVDRVKALFYADRDYRRMLAEGKAAGVPAEELESLAAFLPSGRRNAKRADALAMLEALARHAEGGETVSREAPRFHFEETSYWLALVREHADANAEAHANATVEEGRRGR
jgi:hypothetical protein